MYTEEEERKGFPIRDFLIKLVLVIIFVLLLMWLLPIPKMDGVTDKVFNANIQEMKDASISYFTTDRLPTTVGDKVVLSLKQMLDLKLLLPFTDKDGDTCDVNNSYVQLEKLENEYLLKVYLKCNDDEDYILVHLGCYSYCTSAVCEKEEEVPVVNNGPSCVLEITSGTKGSNNWYNSDVTVAFKSKTASKNATITGYGITNNSVATYNSDNKMVVGKEGTTKVYGYVKDSTGKTAVCNVTVKKDTVKPTCKLSVLSGTKNASGVYVSNVEVGFASKVDATSGIASYDVTNNSKASYGNKTKYTVSTNGTIKVYGYVKDAAGNTNTCNLSVTRYKEEVVKTSTPSCSLTVTGGTKGVNDWYISQLVTVGFASKVSTNGAKIVDYGISTSEKYGKIDSYSITTDGTHTIYGYVKDSNNNLAVCSIKVQRDVTKPNCNLTVTSGTYNANGYYTSDVVIGFNSKADVTSGIAAYGIGKQETYANNNTYSISTTGTHTVFGYVKDKAGNTNTCSISITKKTITYEYQYRKDTVGGYSAWTNWTIGTYQPSNPPKFETTALKIVEDLGPQYKYLNTTAIEKPVYEETSSVTERVCKDYNYYRKSSTTTTVYAIKVSDGWVSQGRVVLNYIPEDTIDTKWTYIGLDWNSCGNTCTTTPYIIWEKFTRKISTVDVTNNTINNGQLTIACSEYETKTTYLYNTRSQIVGYNKSRTLINYQYRMKTRTYTSPTTDYRWSTYDDKSLIAQGYTMTNVSRIAE